MLMAAAIEGFSGSHNEENKDVSKKKSNKKSGGFQSFGLSYFVLKGVQVRGYKVPTPIQRKCIPLILSGRDVVAMARTGSGKTACFLLPMFEKLGKPGMKSSSGPRALIFSPTRELALQTSKFIKDLGRFTKLKSITVLGGDSMDYQFGAMHENPDVVVATPGRFLHLCVEMELKLDSVEYVVFDEADRLFEMGLGDQLQEILYRLPESRQTLLFSATLPKLLIDFAKAGLSNPVLLRLDVETKLPSTLELSFLSVRPEEKVAALLCLLQSLPKDKLTMVFTATKHHVDYLHALLDLADISNTFLYSDLAPAARKINAAKFLNKNCSVIVVTDVAARGVDIPHLDYVINYHFPSKPKLFVHRVGRCARAGRAGTAFSFVSKSEAPYFLELVTFLGRPLNIVLPNATEHVDKKGAFGRIPENLLEAEQARVNMWHENNVDLESMKKVCDNGYKKYLQSNPGASKETLKKAKSTNLTDVGIHPFFHVEQNSSEKAVSYLLSSMKNYKPRGTIFELKSAMKQSFEVMRKTKKAHANYLHKSRKFGAEINEQATKSEGWTPNENTDNVGSVKNRKRKQEPQDSTSPHKKGKSISEEYYVPYTAPDQDTEKGLSVNNFLNDANKVTLDLIGDCDEHLMMQKKIKKWDKLKKKYVTLGNEEKVCKIKTECGTWIDASYKTGRYKKWRERSKVIDEEPDDDDDDVDNNAKVAKKDFPNTHWGRHNRKMAEKLKSKGSLRKPEQILKARKEMENKRVKGLPRILKKKFKNKNK